MSTILFVEDEHAMRAVFGEFLRNEGFTVLEASDMTEASLACDNYSGNVDISILDTKTGMLLANRLAARYPGMSILFIGDSGKAEANQSEAGHQPPRVRHSYLQKPFSSQILLNCLHRLDRTSRAHGTPQ